MNVWCKERARKLVFISYEITQENISEKLQKRYDCANVLG